MSGIIPVVPLTGGLSGVGKLSGSISGTSDVISGTISDDLLAAHKYTGEYTVVPRKVEQVLPTSDKFMAHDVTINAINYSEVSNPQGGLTVNIGYE